MLSGNRRWAARDACRLPPFELCASPPTVCQALPRLAALMPRLSWLAFAGNPFCDEQACRNGTSEFTTEILAGPHWGCARGGASGVIYRAEWARAEGPRAVAVKLFKGPSPAMVLPLLRDGGVPGRRSSSKPGRRDGAGGIIPPASRHW